MPPRGSKIKDVKTAKAWAEISEDIPPQIWNVAWYREHLRQDLRHIRVTVAPVRRAKKAR